MVNVTIDTRELEAKLSEIQAFAERDAIPLAAVLAHDTIKRLSAGGQDVHGRPFKPYTKPYEKFKLKKLGSASPVNLRLENKMLKSASLQDNELGFWDTKEDAKARGNAKHRNFFGASKILASAVRDGLSKHINRLWT